MYKIREPVVIIERKYEENKNKEPPHLNAYSFVIVWSFQIIRHEKHSEIHQKAEERSCPRWILR